MPLESGEGDERMQAGDTAIGELGEKGHAVLLADLLRHIQAHMLIRIYLDTAEDCTATLRLLPSALQTSCGGIRVAYSSPLLFVLELAPPLNAAQLKQQGRRAQASWRNCGITQMQHVEHLSVCQMSDSVMNKHHLGILRFLAEYCTSCS